MAHDILLKFFLRVRGRTGEKLQKVLTPLTTPIRQSLPFLTTENQRTS